MRKITVLSMITLDGVMQGPGAPGEDPSEGFEHSGWAAPFADEEGGLIVRDELAGKVDYLLGRKTYDIWAGYWPGHGDIWPGINGGMKYVLSSVLRESDWENTRFLSSPGAIGELKRSDGRDIQVWGSSRVVHLLLEHDLVDELRLKIYPLVLGSGKRLFPGGTVPRRFALEECRVTSKGVIFARYLRS